MDHDKNDLDAHCIESSGTHIYYASKGPTRTGGTLDVDIISPRRGVPAVENIAWKDRKKIDEGLYDFSVKNFDNRGGRTGFDAQIECDGEIFDFNYPKELLNKEEIRVATVLFSKANGFSVTPHIQSTSRTREMWGIRTGEFYDVTACLMSPNFWDDREGIGNQHFFFMVRECINDTRPNGFYNEYLDNALLPHKQVFEALGSVMRVEDSGDQLSGLGFSSTQRSSLSCRVDGRPINIIF